MSDTSIGGSQLWPWSRPGRGSAAAALIGRLLPTSAPRFLIAGGLASLINWVVRFPLSLLLPFEVAVALAYGLGMVAGFELYRSWVFPGSNLPLGSQVVRFILVNAVGLGVVLLASGLLVTLIGWTGLLPVSLCEGLAHGMALVCGAIVNFAGHRAVTFARRAVGLG